MSKTRSYTAPLQARVADVIHAFTLGVVDGLEAPAELQTGRTWEDDQDCNEAYDHGVNVGQFLGCVVDPDSW